MKLSKKIMLVGFAMGILCFMNITQKAEAANPKTESFQIKSTVINEVNSNMDEMTAYMRGEHVLLPVRIIGEALGFKVTRNRAEDSVSMEDGIVKTSFVIGEDLYYKASAFAIGMSKPSPIGAAPVIIHGKTYVPMELFDLLYGKEKAVSVKEGVLYITRDNFISSKIDKVIVNGTPINRIPFEAFFDGKNTLIPLDLLADILKFKVSRNEKEKSYTLDNGTVQSTVFVGTDRYFKGSSQLIGMSKPKKLESAPWLHHEKLYLPVSFFNLLCGEDTITVKEDSMSILTK
ncbi:MAG: stalk domain-containing protein [Acetivibrio sp.]